MKSNDAGDLVVVARTAYIRDGYAGDYKLSVEAVILPGDTVNQIATKVAAAVRTAGIPDQYDLTASNSILMPSYTKI